MPTHTLTIDGQSIEIIPGETIMQAADRLSITIPRLCHHEDLPKFTSCMVCRVKNVGTGNMTPACSIPAEPGMVIDTICDEVALARKIALELLLSEHLGDCEGPCTTFCPAGMDIPLMIRQIAAGEFHDALKTVKADIALPAVLGRICRAPCESACRRKFHDAPVSICKLKRYVADVDLASGSSWLPALKPASGKTVAIVGAGPMGLAAAWHLAQSGHSVTIHDANDRAGGGIRYGMPEGMLDSSVLDDEIAAIFSLGVSFIKTSRVGETISLDELTQSHDAVLMACLPQTIEAAKDLGLATDSHGVIAHKMTYQTESPTIFSRPGLVTTSTMSIRAVAAGKNAAHVIDRFLRTGEVVAPPVDFNSAIGKPGAADLPAFLKQASPDSQRGGEDGFSERDAQAEALRCLHCDCRLKDNCLLRDYAGDCGAKQKHFSPEGQPPFMQYHPAENVVLEPGKCISCGRCVRICERDDVPGGFTFLDRGYTVTVGTPFGIPVAAQYAASIDECVAACPTGALAHRTRSDL